jgi:hypothetical protein
MFQLFGLVDTAQHLFGGQVNDLHNVMTMAQRLYRQFDLMNLWLEPVPGQVSPIPFPMLPSSYNGQTAKHLRCPWTIH